MFVACGVSATKHQCQNMIRALQYIRMKSAKVDVDAVATELNSHSDLDANLIDEIIKNINALVGSSILVYVYIFSHRSLFLLEESE